jgi:hypothetical protein
VLNFDAATTLGGSVDASGLDAEATVQLTGTGDLDLDFGNGSVDVTGGDLRAENADSLTLSAGDVDVEGLVLSLGDLTVDADFAAGAVSAGGNALFQSRADVAGDLVAGGNLRLRGGVEVGGDLTAGGTIRVRGSGIALDAQGAQTVQAGDQLIVRGDVVKDRRGRLTLAAANGLDLDERVESRGTLVLDGFDDAAGAPTVATVYSRKGDLLLRSRNGDVQVQGDERLVSAGGSLRIEAESGRVEVGDLAALDQVVVNSPRIAILGRPGGPVQTPGGGTVDDSGPDIVARTVQFSSAPTGAGDLDVATPESGIVSATLSRATIRTLSVPLDSALFSGGGGVVLDPRATGAVRTNLGGIIAAESASLFTEQTSLLRSLNEVAVSAKPLWASEVVAFLECGLFDEDDPDLPAECEDFFEDEQGAGDDQRYKSASAKAALETYRFIFSQVDDIRDVFEAAASDYTAASGNSEIEGPVFREYLESTPDAHGAALDYMSRLSALFSQMEEMGLGGDDFVEARQLLIDEVAPPGMDTLDFDDALRSEGGTLDGPREAANPLFAGSPVPGSRWWWQGGATPLD